MQKLKMNRLNEMNTKTHFAKAKVEAKIEKPKVDPQIEEREKELKLIKNQVSKAEKEIERLEVEIKIVDDQLSDSTKYQAIINDKEVFAKYEQMKKQLDAEMINWEALQTKLEEALKQI
jgi:hypothetical protein